MVRLFAVFLCLFCLSACQANSRTQYFVRHFEKQAGIDPHLSELGLARALVLKDVLINKGITTIYSTRYNRTLESVSPLADALGLNIEFYDPQTLNEFAFSLKNQRNILVVGHSNTTAQLIRLLGGDIEDLSENDYGQLFILIEAGSGQKLQQEFLAVK